jgi:serine/threonine protein kinase
MTFDEILLEILSEFIGGKNPNIEHYCEKYPQYGDAILSKFITAQFIKRSFEEEDLSGKQISDYIILHELGRGGMGMVFLGVQPSLSRLTAIKVLPPSFAYDKEALKHFQEEAKIIAKFNHPNIVPIYSIGEEKGINYIAMGYITGLPLTNIIESLKENEQACYLKARTIKELLQEAPTQKQDELQGSITIKRDPKSWDKSYYNFTATIGAEIADALSYAHQNGISHGDIKPSNILITNEGVPVIVDFGLSKSTKQIHTPKEPEFTGTLIYAAPEKIRENIINEKTDIWSLGITLYELLTFRNPFRESTVKKTVDKIKKSCPLPLRHYDKKIPAELEAIVLRCLENKPEQRYASVADISKDLNNYLESKPIKAKPIGRIGRLQKYIKRNPIIFLLTIAIIVFVITSTYLSFNFIINTWKNKAYTFYFSGKTDEAIKQCEKVLKFFPSEKKTLIIMGGSYYLKGEYEKALFYYKRALEIDSNYNETLLGIGDIYYDTGRYDDAVKYFKKAYELSPNDRTCLLSLADAYRRKRSFDEAIYYYGKGVLLDPEGLNIGKELVSLIEKEKKITNYEEISKYLSNISFNEQEIASIIEILKKAKKTQEFRKKRP